MKLRKIFAAFSIFILCSGISTAEAQSREFQLTDGISLGISQPLYPGTTTDFTLNVDHVDGKFPMRLSLMFPDGTSVILPTNESIFLQGSNLAFLWDNTNAIITSPKSFEVKVSPNAKEVTHIKWRFSAMVDDVFVTKSNILDLSSGSIVADTTTAVVYPVVTALPLDSVQIKEEERVDSLQQVENVRVYARKGYYVQMLSLSSPDKVGEIQAKFPTVSNLTVVSRNSSYKYCAGPYNTIEEARNAAKVINERYQLGAFVFKI